MVSTTSGRMARTITTPKTVGCSTTLPNLQAQLADERRLGDDVETCGCDDEVARNARVIASLQRHLDRLERADLPAARPSPWGARAG